MKLVSALMFLVLTTSAVVSAQPDLWTGQYPCDRSDEELFVTILGDYPGLDGVSVEVYDALADTLVNEGEEGLYDPPIRPEEPTAEEPGCHWIATHDTGYGRLPEAVHLEMDMLYRVELKVGGVTKVDFLWESCTASNTDLYCGAVGNGETDTYLLYDWNTGDYQIHLYTQQDWEEEPLIAVDVSSQGDDDLLYPHDVEYFCARISETDNKNCMNGYVGIFVTDQVTDGSEFTHTDGNLKVTSGSGQEGSWIQDWEMKGDGQGGQVTLKMQSGTYFLVDGDATIEKVSFEPQNTSWEGIYVFDGAHLSLNDGTSVELPLKKITSYGELDINEGLPNADSVRVFPVSGSFNNIYISGSGADGSTINRAVVENSLTGVIVGYADNVTVSNSRFQSPSVWAVAFENEYDGFVFNNKIKSSDSYGFYHIYGDTYLHDNIITNSEDYSVYAQGSETYFLDSNYGAGENTLENSDVGIWANYGSVNMGFETEDQPPILYQGNNTVTNNSSYDVRAENGSTVVALGNVWDGEGPTSDIDGSSSFVWSDYSAKSGHLSTYAKDAIIWGDTSPGSNGRFVSYIAELRSNAGRRSSMEFLNAIIRDEDHPQRWLSVIYYMGDMVHERESLESVMKGEDFLLEETLPQEAKSQVARALFHVYTQQTRSPSGASRMRDLLAQFQHKDYEIGLIDDLLGDFTNSIGGTIAYGKRETEILAPDYVLSVDVNAYPNPFNSSTIIEFTLDEPKDMSVTVYDVLGREVQRLAEGQLPEGRYRFRFTPDDFLAQGLYFYRLQSGQKSKVGKLIYVK